MAPTGALPPQEALTRFQAAMDLSPNAIYLVDRATLRFFDVNTTACALLGRSREELLSLSPCEVFALSETQLERQCDEAIAASQSGLSCHHEVPTRSTPAVLLEAPQGALFVEGRWLVISLAKQPAVGPLVDSAAAEYARHLRDIVDRMTECSVVMLDAHGKVLTWNDGARSLTGYSNAEMIGQDYARLSALEDAVAGKPRAQLAMAALLGRLEETCAYRRKDGAPLWARSTLTALRDTTGNLRGYFHVMLDISELQWNKAALRTSELKFAKAINASADLITLSRLQSGEILEANMGFERITGYGRTEAVGHTAVELGLWDESQQATATAVNAIEGHLALDVEVELCRKDGSTRAVMLWVESVDFGTERCLLMIGRDITDWKRIQRENVALQEQLRESQKMQALGTLAGGVAHYFNNALAIILASVNLLREEIAPSSTSRIPLEEIARATERATRLVQQILGFARREPLHREVIALGPVVAESLTFLRSALPAGVDLAVHCHPEAPRVLADHLQIEQALLNLCNNAWQAPAVAGRPRRIEVRVDPCTLPSDTEPPLGAAGRYARITVSDNGPGMTEAVRKRVFEPFFSTKPLGEGTGLGLSVLYGIVQAHGGSVHVDSTPGTGSVFRIYLPAAEGPAAESILPSAAEAAVVRPGTRLLYVDDEPALSSLVKRLLERQGYRVSAYTDPRAALAELQAHSDRYTLAITDYNMPGMTGLEFSRALKALRPDLPVVLISGYISPELQVAAPAAGVQALLYKPDTVAELGTTIARLLNSSGSVAPSAVATMSPARQDGPLH